MEKMIVRLKDGRGAESLFAGWDETMIESCLENIMGAVYADSTENPCSAAAVLGDFAFLSGVLCRELVDIRKYIDRNFIIMVPSNEAWAQLIEEVHGEKAKRVIRYAFKKEPDIFDEGHLQNVVNSLPEEYTLRVIDEELYEACKEKEWSRDLVSQFADYAAYNRLGIGVVILKDGVPVSGASSYSRYEKGIEIEIDTRADYRRRGLAYVCGAALILECCKRNLYPSWDAQNKWSLALAQKLGYHFDHEYTAYEVRLD